MDIDTPQTSLDPILKNAKEILIHTPKCKNKNSFKLKIPLPISPLTSPFLNIIQNGKLTENLPPDKNSRPNKNSLSPIFYNPQVICDNSSSKVQGTKFVTTKVDGRTSEKENEMVVEKETQCSNNTSIINHNILKNTRITTKRSSPLSPTPPNSGVIVEESNDTTNRQSRTRRRWARHFYSFKGIHKNKIIFQFIVLSVWRRSFFKISINKVLPFSSLKICINKGYPMGVRNKKYLRNYILVLFYFSFILCRACS